MSLGTTESAYTSRMRDIVDLRYERGEYGEYFAYGPIYGLARALETEACYRLPIRYAHPYQTLRVLASLPGRTLLDVGSSEGYIQTNIAKCTHLDPTGVDLSLAACERNRRMNANLALAASADLLPFEDNAFDICLMSEIIEHLENPVDAMLEAYRVCRLGLVVTTQQIASSEWVRTIYLKSVNRAYSHVEKNFFTPGDFDLLFGQGRPVILSQGYDPLSRTTNLAVNNPEEARRQIREIVHHPDATQKPLGWVIWIPKESTDPFAFNVTREQEDHFLQELFAALPNKQVPEAELQKTFREKLLPLVRHPADLTEPTSVTDTGITWADGTTRALTPAGTIDLVLEHRPERFTRIVDQHCRANDFDAARQQDITILRDKFTIYPHFGGWGTWFREFLREAHYTSMGEANTLAAARKITRSLLRFARSTARLLFVSPEGRTELKVTPTEASMDDSIEWKLIVPQHPELFRMALEISDPGAKLDKSPLVTGEHSRLYFHDDLTDTNFTQPVRAGVPEPGEYEVRLLALSRLGKVIGEPSEIVRIRIHP